MDPSKLWNSLLLEIRIAIVPGNALIIIWFGDLFQWTHAKGVANYFVCFLYFHCLFSLSAILPDNFISYFLQKNHLLGPFTSHISPGGIFVLLLGFYSVLLSYMARIVLYPLSIVFWLFYRFFIGQMWVCFVIALIS